MSIWEWVGAGLLCLCVAGRFGVRVFWTDMDPARDEAEWEDLRRLRVARRHEDLERYPLPSASKRE